MIITRTPLRMSFFGGGTDFPEYFRENGGAVLGSAINKYIYHFVTQFPSDLFDYSIRLSYRRTECVKSLDEVQHAPFREILRFFDLNKDVEIALAADLPSFSGLGSSSSFTVGLVHALSAFQGRHVSREQLARLAIQLEREVLRETVGWQDQIFAAYGGFNLIEFGNNGGFNVHRVALAPERLEELERSLMLFFTGRTRSAGQIEVGKLRRLDEIRRHLRRLHELVEEAYSILTGNRSLTEFGRLLHQSWLEKRELSPEVSNAQIDEMYRRGLEAGAMGGKLLGAGGGGFLALFVPPGRQEQVRKVLEGYFQIQFQLNAPGSTVIHS
ncbi:MAG TPA: GHMP kinase [Acidobacteriota bacterium]|jgi:D-glycero-alpha-D-manno-heptose-7-phosphate kinase|nr:GHMP kinase [Acidobacteriota bacterium]HRR56272.1 GHMP kinase [Acidobacteriota bacterium]HRV07350.1 GHMP kinase [Acidobacteriota bacterium]